MTARAVIRALEAAGSRQVRSTGSHRHFWRPDKPGTVTVPDHGALGIGLIPSIERQSGMKIRRDQC